MQHKHPLGGSFNKVYHMKNLGICTWAKIANGPTLGFMKDYIKMINISFSGIIHECPYQGPFRVVNASFDVSNEEFLKVSKNVQSDWPNGIYKVFIKVYRKEDDNVGRLVLTYEAYDREAHIRGSENF
jgi:hypothetical protein